MTETDKQHIKISHTQPIKFKERLKLLFGWSVEVYCKIPMRGSTELLDAEIEVADKIMLTKVEYEPALDIHECQMVFSQTVGMKALGAAAIDAIEWKCTCKHCGKTYSTVQPLHF